jgi:hypothetical protein
MDLVNNVYSQFINILVRLLTGQLDMKVRFLIDKYLNCKKKRLKIKNKKKRNGSDGSMIVLF